LVKMPSTTATPAVARARIEGVRESSIHAVSAMSAKVAERASLRPVT
jgi:hypothetical protein